MGPPVSNSSTEGTSVMGKRWGFGMLVVATSMEDMKAKQQNEPITVLERQVARRSDNPPPPEPRDTGPLAAAPLQPESPASSPLVTAIGVLLNESPWAHTFEGSTLTKKEEKGAKLVLCGPIVMALLGLMIVYVFVVIGTKRNNIFQFNVMKNRDSRMRTMNKMFNYMCVIKFQAWEEHFNERIMGYSESEFEWLSKFMFSISGNIVLMWSTPLLISTLTFGTAILLGVQLDAATVLLKIFMSTFSGHFFSLEDKAVLPTVR